MFSFENEDLNMLRNSVMDFVKKEVEPQAADFDCKEQFNLSLFRKLGELGLLGLTVPEVYGGAASNSLAVVIVHEELSYSDPGFALAYLAHALLCVHNLSMNGSEQQKSTYLPKLCSGEWVGSMAMSEPHMGTDVLGMQCQAKKKEDYYLINGQKMWITNGVLDDQGTACDLVWLYAVSGKNEKGRSELSTFIVTKDHEGYEVGQKITRKLGMRASNTAELVFKDCKVSLDHIVGQPGDSLKHMMRNLEIERLGLAAMAIGIAKRALKIMTQYAQERTAFGKNLNHFGQIQFYIGQSYADYQAAKSYVYKTAVSMDLNQAGQRLDSDGVKLVATTMAKTVCDRAIQVLGGYGYVGEYVVERLWRDAKLLEIGGGTLESHQKNITKDLSALNANELPL